MTSRTRGAALVLLPLMSVAAFYCLWIVATNNGFFKQINELVGQEQPLFPGSKLPLMREYTGIAPIDRQLSILVTFFGPVVEGRDEALSIFSISGLGQFGGAWTLLVMESLRSGNRGKAVSFIGTYGFFVQNISFAISTPLYCFIHLLTSPTSQPFTSVHASGDLFVSTYDLAIIPVAVTLGYIIPSLLIRFPAYATFGSPTHQYFLAFWQAFPLWSMLVQWTVKPFCTLFLGQETSTKPEKPTQVATSKSYLKYAGRVYIFVLTLCVATHIPAVVLSLLPPGVVPKSMAVLAHLARPSFASAFIPPLPLGQSIQDMAEGAHIFLLWDMYIGSAAGLLWAVTLYQNVSKGKVGLAPSLSLVKRLIVWTALGGPVAAWAILMWERDEVVKQKLKS